MEFSTGNSNFVFSHCNYHFVLKSTARWHMQSALATVGLWSDCGLPTIEIELNTSFWIFFKALICLFWHYRRVTQIFIWGRSGALSWGAGLKLHDPGLNVHCYGQFTMKYPVRTGTIRLLHKLTERPWFDLPSAAPKSIPNIPNTSYSAHLIKLFAWENSWKVDLCD